MSALSLLRAAALLLVSAGAAQADWGGFYKSSFTPTPRASSVGSAGVAPGAARSVCVSEILRAQLRHNIPGNLLLGIGLQEAGVSRDGQLTIWPWAVNAGGEGRIFDDQQSALDWVRERRGTGMQSIDVGCMQINLLWHPDAFLDAAQGFNPAVNVDYAARFLKQLYAETGDWTLAAGSYHSRTPQAREVYLKALRRNVAVANERIDGFRALAALAPGAPLPQTATAPLPEMAQEAPRPVSTRPESSGFWSAALGSGAGDGARYGIYSDAALQPALPHFVQSN